MENDFTIIKASWLTQVKRNYFFDNELVYQCYEHFFAFLQINNLTTRKIISQDQKINDDSKLIRSDLTEEGYEFFKKAYDRWSTNIYDKGKSPEDVKYLEKKLKEIRGK
jgi:hypothetical protein